MWSSILKEGSDLNIEMYKYSRREKYLGIRHANKDNCRCKASINFNDLWKNLVSEAQEETKCELIFSLITLDFSQRASASFKVEFENPIQGLHIWVVAEVRYPDCCQHVYLRLKSGHRPTIVTWACCVHKSKPQSTTWTASDPFWIVLGVQEVLLRCFLSWGRLLAR